MVCVALLLVHPRTPIYLLRPKPSRAGQEMRSMLGLIESPGLVERTDRPMGGGGVEKEEEEQEEGWNDGKRTDCLAWRRGADQSPPQPISHVLLLCPFLLMTHFLCPSAHFQAKSEKRKSRCVCICLEGVCLCVPVERERTPGGCPRGAASKAAGAGFCQSFPLPQGCGRGAGRREQNRGPSGELDSASSL